MRIRKTTLYDFLGFIIISSIALAFFVGADVIEERKGLFGSGESVIVCQEPAPAGKSGKEQVSGSGSDKEQSERSSADTLSKDPCQISEVDIETKINEDIPFAIVNEEIPVMQVNEDIPMWNETGES